MGVRVEGGRGWEKGTMAVRWSVKGTRSRRSRGERGSTERLVVATVPPEPR